MNSSGSTVVSADGTGDQAARELAHEFRNLSALIAKYCELTADEITVVIEDQGEGFKLADVPDPTEDENLENPGGRGIMLIRSFMNGVAYNDRGNRLTMIKKLGVENE